MISSCQQTSLSLFRHQTKRGDNMQRNDIVIKILELWCKNENLADEVDRQSYTHVSCGYSSAQSFIEDVLSVDVETLYKIYSKLLNDKVD